MNHEETFARFPFGWGMLRKARTHSLAVLALCSLGATAVIRRLGRNQHLLVFDLGIGLVFAAATYVAARRLIASEACHRRRNSAAVLIGVTSAAAVLGTLAVTLSGEPLGAGRLPALVVIQLLGAIGGAGLGLFFGFFAVGLTTVARKLLPRTTPSLEGLVVGAIAGLGGGLIASWVPHLSGWFAAASVAVCAFAGHRAAAFHAQRLAVPRPR